MTCSARVLGLATTGLLVLSGCVAKDPNTLGELDDASTSAGTEADDGGSDTGKPADDDGATSVVSQGDDGGDGADDGADDGPPTMTGSTDDGEPPRLECDAGLTLAQPPGCSLGLGFPLPESGCFEPCAGPGSACSVGTCQLVEVDPCPCSHDPDKCCDACSGQAWLCLEEVGDAVCAAIVGATFRSLEELECGLGPEGVELCHWQVQFGTDGQWLWNYSDLGQGGDYNCVSGVLTITSDATIEHSYDPEAQQLTWEGVVYERVGP